MVCSCSIYFGDSGGIGRANGTEGQNGERAEEAQ